MILNALVEKLKRRSKDDFKGRHYEATLILQAVSWYLRYTLSYRDMPVPSRTRLRCSSKSLLWNQNRPRFEVFASARNVSNALDTLGTENPPHAGRSGPRQYSKLHWRTMPQDTCANEPVNATDPQVEPLPAAIRKGEDEFIVSNIAGGG
jgi:hypothetical protein